MKRPKRGPRRGEIAYPSRPRRGEIVELREDAARWAGFLFAKIVCPHADGSAYVQGTWDPDECKFVDRSGYKQLRRTSR